MEHVKSQQFDVEMRGRRQRRLQPKGAEDWVVVLEATLDPGADPIQFSSVQELLGLLGGWHATGLFNPQRYAIQLHIPAVGPDEALRCAVAYHDLEARAAGLTGCSLARAEVMTLGEFEEGLLVDPAPATAASPPVDYRLVPENLYTTTRALLQASTPTEVTALLVAFVTAAGGSVNVGECPPFPDMTTLDISVGDGERERLHAVAETVSMAGMIIEQSLPWLVEDARLVVRNHNQAKH